MRDEIERIRHLYTKSPIPRMQAWLSCLKTVDQEGIEGDVVECGVWRGGNVIVARIVSPRRLCWLYDTFSGMTQPEEVDGKKAMDSYSYKRNRPWQEATVAEVRTNLQESGALDDSRLRFVVGPVEKTLEDDSNLPEKIAVLRLDTDWHSSTKIELARLYPRLMSGGFLIVDDYGHWPGCRRAVDKYFGGGLPSHATRIDYSAMMVRK
jgi:O-methyltransferase